MEATTPLTPYEIHSITYNVPSASEPGIKYTVTVTDDRYRCTCKAEEFPKTRGKCWHIKAVKAGAVAGKPIIRILPLTAPPPTPAPELVAALFGDGRLEDAIPVETAPVPAWRTQPASGNPSAWLWEA